MKAKRLPLPKRFNVAMTEAAYQRLRDLNADWHFGNNYLLTILLEHFDEVVDPEAWKATMEAFVEDFGPPKAAAVAFDGRPGGRRGRGNHCVVPDLERLVRTSGTVPPNPSRS